MVLQHLGDGLPDVVGAAAGAPKIRYASSLISASVPVPGDGEHAVAHACHDVPEERVARSPA